jgi:hypothetical protein
MKMIPQALLVAALTCAAPLAFGSALAAPKQEPSVSGQRVQQHVRQKQGRAHSHRNRAMPAARAYRNHPWPDPSFDRNGRPYRPNFYSPCTVDLGYGRFASCDAWND